MTQFPIIQAPIPKTSEPLNADPQNFVPSLLEEGVRTGVLTEEEADAVRAGILNILAESIFAVSGENSSSVKEETAKKLLDNVLFHIEASLKSVVNLHSALLRLKNEDVREIYKEGVGMTHKVWNDACELWEKLHKALLPDMDIDYKHLIISSLSSYLGNYNHKYEPKIELEIRLPAFGIDCTCCGIHQVLAVMRTIADMQKRT